ncbi:hypothetical protein [Salipiger mucosus]|uniref:Capsule polysaccharide export inner-membrane protein n=1 Tax=Salipiger mucosus DSM 16094 TaxID=1123237 RepID=S9Q7H5_9RHOB|nr:hypothetical protein [Salipiger mucosus]EPX75553.1 Capsule polysaccharide export inner-membrane protein [Salipiger mucosus DSM 16094]
MTAHPPSANAPRPDPDKTADTSSGTTPSPETSDETRARPANRSGGDDGASRPGEAEEAERQALIAERKRMAAQLETLKNEKMRKQLEQMESEMRPKAPETPPAQEPQQEGDRPEQQQARIAVSQAQPRKRHWLALLSFAIMVGAPVLLSVWYLWDRAHDRYVSYAGFSVRTEEIGSAFDLLGGVAELSGSSSSDTDILYKFIQSPEMVARINAEIDLREVWSRPGRHWSDPGDDPVYAYNPDGPVAGLFTGTDSETRGSIEDLTAYWDRMVKVYSDSGTGLIDLEVQAFTAEESRRIAQLVYDESSAMINRLSAIAREDATRYAREELDQAVERLKEAREALTRFRNRTQIVDPSASMQGQMGILSSLQSELAQTMIDLDILQQTAQGSDPRITQLERRIDVIQRRIAEERRKLGMGSDETAPPDPDDESAFANLVGEYERLTVDREFAEQSYTAALGAYDSALAEAQRQSRYLAAHVSPTMPERATRPERAKLTGLVALFSFLIWAVMVLGVYALRDRR